MTLAHMGAPPPASTCLQLLHTSLVRSVQLGPVLRAARIVLPPKRLISMLPMQQQDATFITQRRWAMLRAWGANSVEGRSSNI